MAGPALDPRAMIWNLLATRRDIDMITLELIGKYHVDREASYIPGRQEQLTFDLVCHLEMIFDLQRTHLQAHTPRITDRLPYLLSLPTAKGAFMCLVKLAADYPGWAQNGDSRRIFIRALQSGVRMLCLHPKVNSEEILSESVQYGQKLNLQSLNAEEELLTQLCHQTLQQTPFMDAGLLLPTSAMNLYPIDDRNLSVATDRTLNFAHDPMKSYWTLYDISWSIVAAFIQFSASNPNKTDDGITTMASSIVKQAIEEIKNLSKKTKTNQAIKDQTILLADIVGILHPVLARKGEVIDDAWRSVYANISNDSTNRDSIYKDPTYISALATFQQILIQRQKVLRDSDDDIQAICSSIPKTCLAAVREYNCQPRSNSIDTGNPMRFYVTNCEKSHIIADNDGLSRLISENTTHTQSRSADLILFPQGELCPVCATLTQAKTYTHIKEILPLNDILNIIDQKKQELKQLRLQRQSDFLGEARETVNVPERRPHSQKSKHNQGRQSKPEPLSLKSPAPLGLTHASSMAALKARLTPKKNRLSGESFTLSSQASSARSEASVQEIKFNYLDDNEKNVTLSADGSISIFWNNEQLEVHHDGGHKVAVSNVVANPVLVLASTNCCAVVGQTGNHHEIECYNLHTGLPCYNLDFMARVRCMAMSANDLHLAVWLDTGIMYLIDLTTQKIIGKLDIKPRPPESAVHCLSFPANGNELVITIRTGEMVEIYSYPVLGGPSSHRLTWPLSKHESDDQGISSSLYSPSKGLHCITFWTNRGVPQLYDWTRKESAQWNRKLNDMKIGNRIYLAVWSNSGKNLVLVNSSGIVFKLTIHHINSIEAMEIAKTRPIIRKSYDVGQRQLLDVKISQDETQIIIAWINPKNQAFIQTIPVDPFHTGTNKSFISSPTSKNMF